VRDLPSGVRPRVKRTRVIFETPSRCDTALPAPGEKSEKPSVLWRINWAREPSWTAFLIVV
jgi:hypothetical protein